MTLLFPLRYLRLENAYGSYLVRRDTLPTLLLMLILCAPFIIIGGTNYFHKDGFVDKLSAFSGVLTGFYVAALIAVATFSPKLEGLDVPITQGEIRQPRAPDSEKGDLLTRREYVCYMFGYLAFVSLILSISCIMTVVISPGFGDFGFPIAAGLASMDIPHGLMRAVAICAVSLPLSSLAITTVRGLYYLVERLYAEAPQIDEEPSTGPPEAEG